MGSEMCIRDRYTGVCSEDEFFWDFFSEGDIDGDKFDFVRRCRLCFAQYGQEERVGGVVMCAGEPVSWHSKTQKSVTLSTTQVEYVAMSDMGKEILF